MSLFHRDAFGRVSDIGHTLAGYDYYLRPHDGRLTLLKVQGTDDAFGYGQKSWARNGRPYSRIPAIIKLVHWTYSSVLEEGSEERHYTVYSILLLLAKWIPSCLLLAVLLIWPQNLEGIFKNGGFYDRVQYRDWRYPKVSRNRREGEQAGNNESGETSLPGDWEEIDDVMAIAPQSRLAFQLDDEKMDEEFDDQPARHFRPRYLCFLQDGPDGLGTEYETRKVTDWIKQHADYSSTDFVFVSYTRKQFLVSPEKKWRAEPLPDDATRAAYSQQANTDRDLLLAYGMEAARSAKKRAFWIDFECIRDADDVARIQAQSDDVYRICDIVRAAHSLVVIVGPPHDTKRPEEPPQDTYSPESMHQWLQQWGTRLWTLPEILLCSPEQRIKLYAVGASNPPEEIAKRNLAARSLWPDAKLVRQLVDHYESSIHLTPLELISIALECFAWRQTDQYNNGDISYALMGLLRRRPAVDKSDKSFEAFARLSLANDSDELLERLICMQPIHLDAPWYKIRDAWGARLWDIEPQCQVAGIVDDQTITLDGAYGATIQWDSMEPVAFLKRPTRSREISKVLVHGAPVYLIISLAIVFWKVVVLGAAYFNEGTASPTQTLLITNIIQIMGLFILVGSVAVMLLAPMLLLDVYRGKFWSTQAHFVGLEGIPSDIGDIERLLFGFNHGRLKWSTAASTLSRSGRSDNGERVGLPPLQSHGPDHDADDEETVFTLIDTYTMTATAFRAIRPPTVVLVCGREGGMQRAILCSYDWRDSTFVRETVIRVKTLVLDRMFRVDRFRFALGRRRDSRGGHVASLSTAEVREHESTISVSMDQASIVSMV
ncbi:hypothetical protein NPX13_g2982 [Xylaria arbuscula]|uniref:Heterokaryon incompatibility domain-containing protein n=1 Tax=Xylaria arbuscula TaxID=114810 RepID=A0A9W8TQK1_9PEZI|nr:hypothetical protein NPX13_g2982 [Xylaria arbuscula]